jgi:hypothetical protein
MTREESRARNALEKVSNKCRKQVAKSFGWKQNDYLNWKIDSGYYFSLCHLVLEQVELSVKPYFIDDLWWDIFELPECKQAPKSIRGNGSFAVPDIVIKEYTVFDTGKIPVYTEDDVLTRWESTFNTIESDIARFLRENPNPESFCPTGQTNRIYDLMMDIHAGNLDQVLEKIELYKTNHMGVFFRGPKGYDYEYIERWIGGRKQ